MDLVTAVTASLPMALRLEVGEPSRLKTVKFRDDQIKTVQAAIDRAKKIAGAVDDSAALRTMRTSKLP